MFNIIKDIKFIIKRYIMSTVFIEIRNYVDKYCQWKNFMLSIIILFLSNLVLSTLLAIIFPPLCILLWVSSIIFFIKYWIDRFNKLKALGLTRNAKYWNDKVFWQNLKGWHFEHEVADVFSKQGYKTEVTKGSGDGGVDIIMYKDGLKYIVQCKNHVKPVTPNDIRALWGVKEQFNADKVIMVATNGATTAGRAFIYEKDDYLIFDINHIIQLATMNPTIENKVSKIDKIIVSLQDKDITLYLGISFIVLGALCFVLLS